MHVESDVCNVRHGRSLRLSAPRGSFLGDEPRIHRNRAGHLIVTRRSAETRTGEVVAKFTHYAKALAPSTRKKVIAALEEAELRAALREMFERALSDADVHLTHGNQERGKDLVIVQRQPFGEEVFALVVKCGKLTAEAKGPVDTVISQARMAYEMDAQIPTRLAGVEVNDVWIVASGNITNGAKDRVRAQLPVFRPRFFDSDALDDLFVEHYPEVYFHGQLLAYIDETAAALESDHLYFSDAAATLSDVFVEPYLLAAEMEVPGEDYEIEQVLSESRFRFGKIGETLKHHKRMLIVGEPGVGKSASLRKMTIDGLHRAASAATQGAGSAAVLPVPVYVKASRLVDCCDGASLCAAAIPEDVPTSSFRVSAILVDGLDEVASDLHDTVIRNAATCADELDAPLIVSSRNVDTVAQTPEGYKRYEMLPFEFAQAVEFFTKMVTSADKLEELKDALEQIRANLALTPLTLLLLVQLAEGAEEIPATIGELYDRFTDEVLGKSDFARGVEVLFDYQIRKRFLAALSFDEFYIKNRLEIPLDELTSYAQAHFATYGYSESNLEGFLQELERAEILRIEDSVSFKHRSFLEYFCALQVAQEPERVGNVCAWAVDTYFSDEWSDVAFYYFGHRRLVPDDVLNEILGRGPEDDMLVHLRKFLVGRLLQAGWHTPVPQRIVGMQGALAYVEVVREDFKKIAAAVHGSVPDILADVAILGLAERSFKSGVMEIPARAVLDRLPAPDAPESEWLAYVAVLRALRRQLGEDDLLRYAAGLEAAASQLHNPSLEARLLILAGWTLEEYPAAKKSLERKFRELAMKYNEAVRAVLPPPKKGWRPKSKKKS